MFATRDNPAADARQMRRIIAEDPDWLVNDFVVIMFFLAKDDLQPSTFFFFLR